MKQEIVNNYNDLLLRYFNTYFCFQHKNKRTQERTYNKTKSAMAIKMVVGMAGLEPTTSRPPGERATRLRHIPNEYE